MKHKSNWTAPPFDDGGYKSKPTAKYFWWSWNPHYPYWSKSCWGGVTIQQACDAIKAPMASKMKLYHNKLIREADGELTEVFDLPFGNWGKLERMAKE